MTFVVGLLLATGLAFALDRVGLWMEARGWLYYRKKRGTCTLGRAVLEAQALMDPGKRYVLEAERTDSEEEDSADPPTFPEYHEPTRSPGESQHPAGPARLLHRI